MATETTTQEAQIDGYVRRQIADELARDLRAIQAGYDVNKRSAELVIDLMLFGSRYGLAEFDDVVKRAREWVEREQEVAS